MRLSLGLSTVFRCIPSSGPDASVVNIMHICIDHEAALHLVEVLIIGNGSELVTLVFCGVEVRQTQCFIVVQG